LHERMTQIRNRGGCNNLVESIDALAEVAHAEESLAILREPVDEMKNWMGRIDQQLLDGLTKGDPAFMMALDRREKGDPALGGCFPFANFAKQDI